MPPSRDLARQALLFLGRFVLSFFVPPILTVFYLIDLCDKEQKKERLRRRLAQGMHRFQGVFQDSFLSFVQESNETERSHA